MYVVTFDPKHSEKRIPEPRTKTDYGQLSEVTSNYPLLETFYSSLDCFKIPFQYSIPVKQSTD